MGSRKLQKLLGILVVVLVGAHLGLLAYQAYLAIPPAWTSWWPQRWPSWSGLPYFFLIRDLPEQARPFHSLPRDATEVPTVMMALASSSCAILVIWASSANTFRLLAVLAALTGISVWSITLGRLFPASPAHGTLVFLSIEGAMIALPLCVVRLFRQLVSSGRSTSDASFRSGHRRFTLRYLLACIAMLAVLLASLRALEGATTRIVDHVLGNHVVGRAWDGQLLIKSSFNWWAIVVGSASGVLALITLCVMHGKQRVGVRVLIAAALGALVGFGLIEAYANWKFLWPPLHTYGPSILAHYRGGYIGWGLLHALTLAVVLAVVRLLLSNGLQMTEFRSRLLFFRIRLRLPLDGDGNSQRLLPGARNR